MEKYNYGKKMEEYEGRLRSNEPYNDKTDKKYADMYDSFIDEVVAKSNEKLKETGNEAYCKYNLNSGDCSRLNKADGNKIGSEGVSIKTYIVAYLKDKSHNTLANAIGIWLGNYDGKDEKGKDVKGFGLQVRTMMRYDDADDKAYQAHKKALEKWENSEFELLIDKDKDKEIHIYYKNIEFENKTNDEIVGATADAVIELIPYYDSVLAEYISISEIMDTLIAKGQTKQIVFTGAPGTGKTYGIREYLKKKYPDRYEFVQFHPSYDYTDFVEGLRPISSKNGETKFVRMDGTFKAFCRRIIENGHDGREDLPYFFVIDEINRADLSKVFGELMYCIEEDKRGEENSVPTQYSNLPTYKIANGNVELITPGKDKLSKFYIPSNVYIIGTMNDIDRSVETFDFALRRRFKWIDIKANDVMFSTLKQMSGYKEKKMSSPISKLCGKIYKMNEVISGDLGRKLQLGEQFHIGPAYFKEVVCASNENESDLKDAKKAAEKAAEKAPQKVKKDNIWGKKSGKISNELVYSQYLDIRLEKVWKNRIEPLLKEYCRGQNRKDTDKLLEKCKKALDVKDQNTGNASNEDVDVKKPNTGNASNKNDGIKKFIKPYLTSDNKQIIFTGAPGTGKTTGVRECLEEMKADYEFVQFHPSYDYTDFVEGLRPVEKNGKPAFVRIDGVFKAFCRQIIRDKNKDKKYYFVIDEINRADLSKVFGELMYGMEESYRGEENVFLTQYSNLTPYEVKSEDGKPTVSEIGETDWFQKTMGDSTETDSTETDSTKTDSTKTVLDGFYIPENLYIIGTMNDIDRSVETFDFALRRRFKWVNINANVVMKDVLVNMLIEKIDAQEVEKLADCMIAMNNIICGEEGKKYNFDESYCIGPAYLKDYTGDKNDVWERRINPILNEYCRGKNIPETFIDSCKNAFMDSGNAGE